MTQLTAQQQANKRITDRASARRRAAIAQGRNPALVTGEPRPLARIRLPRARVPLIPGARCQGQPDLFFSDDPEDITAAVFICCGCPGRLPCLAGAVERREEFGVWGGTDFDRSHQVNRQEQAS